MVPASTELQHVADTYTCLVLAPEEGQVGSGCGMNSNQFPDCEPYLHFSRTATNAKEAIGSYTSMISSLFRGQNL